MDLAADRNGEVGERHSPSVNGLAVASLLCALFVVGGPYTSTLALVLGYRARAQIRESGQRGALLARVGIALGWIEVALIIVIFLTFVLALSTNQIDM